MADIRVIVDGKEYAQEQFEKDMIRMFDAYRYEDDHMGEMNCKDVSCTNCPLNKYCDVSRPKTFEEIKIIYKWVQKHPAVTNKDKHPIVTNKNKLEELFGIWIEPTIVIGSENKDEYEKPLNFEFLFMKNGDHTVLAQFKEKNDTFWSWLNEEYKEPKGEKKNG